MHELPAAPQQFECSSVLKNHIGTVETDVGLSSLGSAEYVHMYRQKPVFGQPVQASLDSLLALGLFSHCFFFSFVFVFCS